MSRAAPWAATALALGALIASWAGAHTAPAPMRPSSARQSAPIDLTGEWVSIVTEDWRWRMLPPGKGDYTGVPLNDAGRKMADTWSPADDGSCKAYGAGGVMRMPLRVQIDWDTDEVLRVTTDAGRQVRRFYFSQAPANDARTLQGHSVAEWEHSLPPGDCRRFAPVVPPPAGGALKVVTTGLQPGWLRRNGVPYSENARVTEYYDRFSAPDGSQWFVVTTIVDDPRYLQEPFVTSSHFRREHSSAHWKPNPCRQ